MKPILFIAILVFAVAAVGGYLLADRFLRQQAIDACLKAATVESVTTKTEGANTPGPDRFPSYSRRSSMFSLKKRILSINLFEPQPFRISLE